MRRLYGSESSSDHSIRRRQQAEPDRSPEPNTEAGMSRHLCIQPNDDGFWVFIQRSAGNLPQDHLHVVLTWLLEQLNFGNFETQRDSDGALVSMTIGKAAAPERVSEDEVLEPCALSPHPIYRRAAR